MRVRMTAHPAQIAGRLLEALSVPALVGVLSVASACGGGGSSSPSPAPTAPSNTTTNSSAAATITIGSSIDPNNVRIEVGQSVRFVNSSTQVHDLRSDPHPTHGSCPEIDRSGTLRPGASVVVGPFNAVTSCHYHDHDDPTNASLQGTLRVGTDESPSGPNYILP
jgi:plastocyanin